MRGLLCLLLVVLSTSCISNRVGYRDQRCDPDQQLADLLEDYEQAKHAQSASCACRGQWRTRSYGDCCDGGHIVIDCDRIRSRIQALSFEYPAHIPALLANAMIAFEERDRIASLRYLDRLLAIQPVHPEAAVLRARVGLAEGNLPAAKKLIAEQIRHAPAHPALHEAFAEILFLEGRYEEARNRIGIAEELGAPSWRMAFNRGLIAETEGDLDAAWSMYSIALEIKPDMALAAARLSGVQAVMNQSR